ncbi:MAG: SGNH/GDSL hydrolase family protein [Actinomycetota bacterium]
MSPPIGALRSNSAVRRVALALGAGLMAAVAVVGRQVQAARRRDYLRFAPDDELDASTEASERPLLLVVIGDSTAVGVGAGSRSKSYPSLLAERVRAHRPVRLAVLGRPGLRWQHVGALVADAIAMDPDLVVIGVGGNDAIHMTPLSRVRATVGLALDELQRSRTTVLVVLGPRFDSPAVPHPLRDLIARRCRAVNRAITMTAGTRGVRVLDTESVIGDAFARDPVRLYSEDMFHPSAAGYELWAGAIEDAVVTSALEVTVP